MRRGAVCVVVAAAIAAAPSCGEGVSADAGLDASMRVDGAQFHRGRMPDGAGPNVASVDLATNQVRAGEIGMPLGGALAPGATAVGLMLDDDPGYWILPAGAPDVVSPTFPSFRASLSFSRDTPGGLHTLVVRAADGAAHFGPSNTDNVLAATPFGVPQGTLVVALTWDTEADLDLHVVDPHGVEIFDRNISSYVPPSPGQASDPNAYKDAGILDFDSNASCVIDGRRRENVIWSVPPPTGHYVARVDTPSLCGQIGAHWTVRAYLEGKMVAEAEGASFDAATRPPHDRGAGVLAIELDVP